MVPRSSTGKGVHRRLAQCRKVSSPIQPHHAPARLANMSGWKYAFSLSNEDVDNANPPGTADLIGR